jgi:hypothetical protein
MILQLDLANKIAILIASTLQDTTNKHHSSDYRIELPPVAINTATCHQCINTCNRRA